MAQITDSSADKRRIVLYSHDTMGLGHVRRNLLIAQALARADHAATVLLICGAREAAAFSMPAGIDSLALPALRKELDGRYEPRALDVPLEQLSTLRARIIDAAVSAFNPDLVIVDSVPRGARHELEPMLARVRAAGRGRCVLGLRDVLDDGEAVRHEWRRMRNYEAMRQYYDEVWVYGDRCVYDACAEYGFDADVRRKLRYTGYLDQRMRLAWCDDASSLKTTETREPFVLCLVGGGQDGDSVAEAFVRARAPRGVHQVVVTGPFMQPWIRRALLDAGDGNVTLLEFCPEPAFLIERATCVVAMGGYNTMAEILSFRKPALIVPRVVPRREQWVRAECMHRLGAIDVLHFDELTPEVITEWLARHAPTAPAPQLRRPIDMDGLRRIPEFVDRLLGSDSCSVVDSPSSRRTLGLN